MISRGGDDAEPSAGASVQEAAAVQEILEALFVTDPQADLLKARSRNHGRVAGTCEWILQRAEYASWRHQAAPQLLMIVGEPGIGKTAMATFLVERMVAEAAEEECQSFAYFFCNHAEPQRRSAISILKALLHQILTRRPQLVEHAQRLYALHGAAAFDDMETLWFLFVRVVQDPRVGQLTLLIDSLDNCEVTLRRVLVKRLEELLRAATSAERHHWRLLILTRPQAWDLGTCRRLVSGWTELEWMIVITMSSAVVGQDLHRLIRDEVDRIATVKRWSDETRRAVTEQLEANNGGTFLWISLALRCVADVKEDSVLRKIKRYSCSLRDLYVRVLRKIDPEDVDLAECTLHYVLGAVRPLTLNELAIALHYRDSQNRSGQLLPTDAQIDHLKSAIRSCDTVLRISGKGPHATVDFIHQSVADFLVEHKMPLGLRRYGTTYSRAAERLSTACAAYLHTPEMKSLALDVRRMVRTAKARTVSNPPQPRDSMIDRQVSPSGDSAFSPASSDVGSTKGYMPMSTKQMALFQYATSTWASASSWKQLRSVSMHVTELIKLHTRSQDLIFETAKIAISEGYDLIFRHLIKILLRTLSLEDGLHLFQTAIQYDESGIEPAPGARGRVFWTEELPDAEAIYHELKRRWSNLVHAASTIGLVDVVKFCIQQGDDDVYLKDVNGLTPLHMAAKGGYHEVVEVLTVHTTTTGTGANRCSSLREIDRHGQIPLHLAISSDSSCSADVVRALLKTDHQKRSLYARDHIHSSTPLHLAVKLLPPRPDLVQILLDSDMDRASLYVRDCDDRLPLHHAAIHGHGEIVMLLSEADCEGRTLIARDRHGATALDYANHADRAGGGEDGETKEAVEYLQRQSMILMFGEITTHGKETLTAETGGRTGGRERPRTIAVRTGGSSL